MLRQACVSTFKFAGLAFLGMNVRPKPAATATAGDLGTKIEEGVAAAAAAATAATVPLVDPSAQPTAGGTASTSGDVRTNLQGDNPQMANPNDDNCGCAKPEERANVAGPSVDPQAPTPPPSGGSSADRNVSTTKPACKAPLVYVNCKCKKCWCTKCKCTKDAVLCCAKACGTKACGTKACGTKACCTKATNQTGGGPSQDASVGDLGTKIKKGLAAAATVPLVDLIAPPSTAGGLSTSAGQDSSGGVRTNSQGNNPQPQMANPIGGSANPKDGAPGPSVDPLASIPPSAGGGSSVPESTNPKPPRVDPMDNQDKCKMCAVFYSAYRAETKASNQAADGDGGPSKDAATAAAGNGGDKNDRRNEESIPPQDGASRVESQVEPPSVQTTLWNDLSIVGIPGEALGFIAAFWWIFNQ